MWSTASHVLIAQPPKCERPRGSITVVRMANFNASAVAEHAWSACKTLWIGMGSLF